MGWAEKEYALREARLRGGAVPAEAAGAERVRIAELAIRSGRFDRAIELLDPWNGTDSFRALAAGLAALRSGREREAALLLKTAESSGAPDRDLIRYRRAEAEHALAEADHGLPLLLEIAGEPGRFRDDATEAAALELLRRGRRAEGLALLARRYGPAYEGLTRRELLFQTADAERLEGRPATAASLYRRLLEDAPDSDRALPAFRAILALESEERIPRDPRLPLLGARAAARAGETREAESLLAPLAVRGTGDPLGREALLETGKVRYAAGEYRSALAALDGLILAAGETGREAILYQARAYRKLGAWAESMDAYGEYVRRYPESSLAPEAQWEIAWRLKLLHENDRSAEAFRAVRARFPGSDLAARAPLQEAHCADAAGRPDEALAIVKEFLRGGASGSTRVEALYWGADLAERLGDSASAGESYRELARRHPETYYGLRAAARIGATPIRAPGTWGEGAEADPLLAWIRTWCARRSPSPPAGLEEVAFYAALGEWDEARRKTEVLRLSLAEDPERLLALARLCRRSTLYDETIRCGRRIQDLAEAAGADGAYPHLLALIYPPAYLDLVAREASGGEDPDPLFLLALMRQESWFHPEALSSAGARGLMQIMPATGRKIAASLGEEGPFRAEGLDEPDRNVRYGVWYFRSLLERYGGDPVVAASAYNAGEGNADAWTASARGEGTDRYVEKIAFSETRDYVRRILSGYWICRTLYGASAPRGLFD
jgi:soluble lytic murein transglycosylase